MPHDVHALEQSSIRACCDRREVGYHLPVRLRLLPAALLPAHLHHWLLLCPVPAHGIRITPTAATGMLPVTSHLKTFLTSIFSHRSSVTLFLLSGKALFTLPFCSCSGLLRKILNLAHRENKSSEGHLAAFFFPVLLLPLRVKELGLQADGRALILKLCLQHLHGHQWSLLYGSPAECSCRKDTCLGFTPLK